MTGADTELPYSAAVAVGDLIVTSGQVPMGTDGGPSSESFEDQFNHVFQNVAASLASVGCELGDIFKLTCYLSDEMYFEPFNRLYRAYFDDPLPARTTMGVSLFRGFKIEVEAWAMRRRETLGVGIGPLAGDTRDAK